MEGAVSEGGRGRSVWDTFCETPDRVFSGQSGAVACDHYHRYPEDIGLMRDLGVDAYRFSIAWPRVQPEGTGAANAEGLDFYDRLVDALCEAGITPVATVYHWDTPQPIEDAGGWLSRDTAKHFADYAAIVGDRLADRVPMWIPINEPMVTTRLRLRHRRVRARPVPAARRPPDRAPPEPGARPCRAGAARRGREAGRHREQPLADLAAHRRPR